MDARLLKFTLSFKLGDERLARLTPLFDLPFDKFGAALLVFGHTLGSVGIDLHFAFNLTQPKIGDIAVKHEVLTFS